MGLFICYYQSAGERKMNIEKLRNNFYTISEKYKNRYGDESTLLYVTLDAYDMPDDNAVANVVTIDQTNLIEQCIIRIGKYCNYSIEEEYIELDVMYAIEEYVSLKIASVLELEEYYDCSSVLRSNLNKRYTVEAITTQAFLDILFSLDIETTESTMNTILDMSYYPTYIGWKYPLRSNKRLQIIYWS